MSRHRQQTELDERGLRAVPSHPDLQEIKRASVADMVAMAARESFNGAYGPSYLEIPRDILDREAHQAGFFAQLERERFRAKGVGTDQAVRAVLLRRADRNDEQRDRDRRGTPAARARVFSGSPPGRQ